MYLCLSHSKHSMNVWHYVLKVSIYSCFTCFQSISLICLTALITVSKAGCWTTSVYRGIATGFRARGWCGNTKGALHNESQVQVCFALNNMCRQVTLSVWVTVFLFVKWVLQALSGLISMIFSNFLGVGHWPIRTGAATSMGRPRWCGLAAWQPHGVIFRVPASPRHLQSCDLFPNHL